MGLVRINHASHCPVGKKLKLAVIVIALALLAVIFCSGCMQQGRSALAAVSSRSKPYQEVVDDPVMLTTIRSVAVFPFADEAPQEGFDADNFSTRLASQLASTGELRVLYPRQIMAMADQENRKIRRHNATYRNRKLLGITPADDRANMTRRANEKLDEAVAGEEDVSKRLLDPVNYLDDAITIGRLLGVDAVIMGEITDYDPYMRPRIGLTMRVVATGSTRSAAEELMRLTQWGVPGGGGGDNNGVVWVRQQNFDSKDGNVGLGAYKHVLTHHVDNHPYDTETVLRSMTLYFDYVTLELSKALVKAQADAQIEAEERALQEASRMHVEKTAVRQRIFALVNGRANLPDSEKVISNNLYDRRDRSWRADQYNLSHPAKADNLLPNGRVGDVVETERE